MCSRMPRRFISCRCSISAADVLFSEILRPIRIFTRHPLLLARFGIHALRSATAVARRFRTNEARALLAGCAAHSIVPLDQAATASFGIVFLATGHITGWPFAKTGSQAIADALAQLVRSFGGEIRASTPVRSMRDIPASRVVLFDVTPRQLATIAGDALPRHFLRRLDFATVQGSSKSIGRSTLRFPGAPPNAPAPPLFTSAAHLKRSRDTKQKSGAVETQIRLLC